MTLWLSVVVWRILGEKRSGGEGLTMATIGYGGLSPGWIFTLWGDLVEALRAILLSDALETVLKWLNRNDWGNFCRLFTGRKAGNLKNVHIYQI